MQKKRNKYNEKEVFYKKTHTTTAGTTSKSE